MLGKLLKHEWKATARLLLPLYLVLVVFTLIDRIVIDIDIFKGVLSVIPPFVTFAYIITMIAVVAVSSVLIIYRFYKNLMTDEGYLMFTLPVNTHHLIVSKLVLSILWVSVSMAATVFSIIFVISGSAFYPDFAASFKIMFSELSATFGSTATLFYVEFILLMVFSILNKILMIYFSIAIGQLMNGHKIIGSVGAYIGLNTITSIIGFAAMALLSLLLGKSVSEINTIPQVIFPAVLLFLTVLNIIFYYGTVVLFKKKLNL